MKNSILFVMVDQLSAKWMEAALERDICPLPNLRRLMRDGVTFTGAITNNPVCCPARATLATGLSTRGHGVLENGYALDPALPTFMQSLQRAGYTTGAFGKCHFVPHQLGFDVDYHAYGFDVTHITEDSRGGEWLDWARGESTEHFDDVLATVWADHIPAFAAYGPQKEDLAARIQSIRQGYDWTQGGRYPRSSAEAYPLPFPKRLSQTEWITRHAVDFIQSQPDGAPFFAHVSYVQPHNPYGVPAEYLERVAEKRIPAPVPAEWHSDPAAPGYFKRQREFHLPDDAWARKCYFADLAYLDEQLGVLRQSLAACGRAQDTWVFFTADHGDLLGDHGFFLKEERHYDACIRVPLVVAGPGCQRGVEDSRLVQPQDICPTLLEIGGTQLPAPRVEGPYLKAGAACLNGTHGASLLPLCRGEETRWREAAYVESFNPIWSCDYTDWARTVRTADYRYTCYAGNTGEQLFCLADDPNEQHNLAHSAAHGPIKQRMRDILLEQLIYQDWPKTPRDRCALGVH